MLGKVKKALGQDLVQQVGSMQDTLGMKIIQISERCRIATGGDGNIQSAESSSLSNFSSVLTLLPQNISTIPTLYPDLSVMHTSLSFAVTFVLAAQIVYASPNNGIEARNLSPQQCSKVVVVIDLLKLHSATPFCSSFLGIHPTITTAVSAMKTTM